MLHRGARPLVCLLALLTVPQLPLSAQQLALNSDAGWIPPALTAQGQAAANPDGIAVDALAMLQRGEANGDPAPIREMFRLATMATSRQKQSAWGPFLSARGLLALVRMEAPPMLSDAQREGEGYVEAFWRHLLMAIERDPSFAPARELAATQLVAAGDRYLTADQRRLVERMVAAPSPSADFLLVHARDLRTAGHHDRALAAVERAATLGGDAGRLALERARTLMALGRGDEATRAYWAGLRALTPVAREAYRFDLAWILEGDTLAAFDALPDVAVQPWLQRFWAERDAAAANRPGERLSEHLRRWTVAFRDYRVPKPERRRHYARVEYLFDRLDRCVANDSPLYERLVRLQPSLTGDIRFREPLLDHRGLIYLRHGEPAGRVVGVGTGPIRNTGAEVFESLAREIGWAATLDGGSTLFAPVPNYSSPTVPIAEQLDRETVRSMERNESWLYWIEGAWRVLHFRGSVALGQWGPTTLTSYLPVKGYGLEWFLRGRLDPQYAQVGADLINVGERRILAQNLEAPTCIASVLAVIDRSRGDARAATTADSDTPPLTKAWNAVVQSYVVGSARDATSRALVTFAIPLRSLVASDSSEGRRVYPVTFRLVAYEAASGRTVSVDTLRQFVRSGVDTPNMNVAGWFEVPLPAGTWQLAVRMAQHPDSVGAYGLQRGLAVPDAALSLSSIVPGVAGTSLRWPGDGEGFPVNTLGVWQEGATVELYYEVHGLAEGTAYQTTLEVKPQNPRVKTTVRIRSSDRATGAFTQVRKSLALGKLPVGTHWLTVSVEEGGRTVTSRQAIVVVKR